jgi:hypothetical protein
LGLQQGNSNVVYWDPSRGFAVALSIMSMAVDHQVCAMAVDYFSQPRCSEKRINFRDLALDGR